MIARRSRDEGAAPPAEVEVDTARPGLRIGQTAVDLRQKTFLVLLYLLEHRDGVVSKEELLQTVWGGAAVTEGTLSQCLVDLRRALQDDAKSPRYLKTYPKSGYQLVCEVELVVSATPALPRPHQPAGLEVTSVELEIEDEIPDHVLVPAPSPALPPARSRARPWTIAVVAVALTAAAIGLALARQRRQPDLHLPATPGKTAVAVLFFENRSRSPELDWLREGLADMLIADLSRSPRLSLLSRQQLGSILKALGHEGGGDLDLAAALEVGRRSRASALVLGTFTRIRERTRLDVELHDAATGRLLGTETAVAESPEQILTEVDLVATRLSARLGAPLGGDESHRTLREVRTRSLDAYRYYSLALERTRGLKNDEAIAFLRKAIALDPDFSMAHARIGYALAVAGNDGVSARPHLERALAPGERLTPIDRLQVLAWDAIARRDWPAAIQAHRRLLAQFPEESELYASLARLLLGESRVTEAAEVLRRGLVADPDDAELHNILSGVHGDQARHDEAVEEGQRYVALAPREANAHDTLAIAYHRAGRHAEALAEFDRALALDPDFGIAVIHRGNLLAEMGRYREAHEAFARYVVVARAEEAHRGFDSSARLHLRKRDLAAAERLARLALACEPPGLTAAWLLAEARGQSAEASRLAERIHATALAARGARSPLRGLAWVKGVRALHDGRPDQAIAELREAVRHRALPWAIDPLESCLADAYLELGRLPEAVEEYERVLRVNPRAPLALYRLGVALDRLGRKEEAERRFRSLLEVWKGADADIPELVDARRRLAARDRAQDA